MSEINHHHTEEVVCPHCGHVESDSAEYSDSADTKCDECGKRFHIERDITVTYSTEKAEEKTEDKTPQAP